MEDTMKVLELLEEIEDLVDEAPGLPLTGKIMLDAEEVFQLVREIRLALPDDVQQAKWIRDERDRILAEAKDEYERIIRELTEMEKRFEDIQKKIKRGDPESDLPGIVHGCDMGLQYARIMVLQLLGEEYRRLKKLSDLILENIRKEKDDERNN